MKVTIMSPMIRLIQVGMMRLSTPRREKQESVEKTPLFGKGMKRSDSEQQESRM